MRHLICLLLTVSLFQLHAQTHVDTSMYAILPYNDRTKMAMDWPWTNVHSDSLTPQQVDEMESLVDSAYKAYTQDSTAFLHHLEPLEHYGRQYVAVINQEGDREIWINFFCSSLGLDWKHYAVVVDDGGVCFFQMRVNLTKRKVMALLPNGIAAERNYSHPRIGDIRFYGVLSRYPTRPIGKIHQPPTRA